MRDKVAILSLLLGTLGFICLAYSVLLPRWFFQGGSYGVSWGGQWMDCKWNMELQCGLHSDLLGMSIPLSIGNALALSGVLISAFAMRGTSCCGDNTQKMLFASVCLYLISCLVTLGPLIWFTSSLGHHHGRSDIGECFYLAWVSEVFLLTAGVLQIDRYSHCRWKEKVTQNCTQPLEHEGEEERCGENGESMCVTAQQEMVCLNKYERTAGDSVTEPV